MSVLQAFDLYRFYHADEEETLALRGVSMAVNSGEIVAVMGPSGSGKSTLLACLAGLDEPDGGFVELMGQRLTRRPEPVRAAIRAAEIGIVMQSANLFDHLTVAQNVRFQMRVARKVNEGKLRTLIERVGLSDQMHAPPPQLSGGQAARAALAVALATEPNILLADEPTGEVDSRTEQDILDLLRERKNAGGAVIVATHSDAVAALADRVIRLVDGRIVND